MKRIVYLATSALLTLLIFAPAAVAQEMMEEKMMEKDKMMDESKMMEKDKMDESKMMEEKMIEQPKKMEKDKKMEMPKTGGPSPGLLLLPAAALLLGTGLVTGYVVRRKR